MEIARRKLAGKGYAYHWNYRRTLPDGRRRAKYGGSLTTLIKRNPQRWERYLRNSRRHKRKRNNAKDG